MEHPESSLSGTEAPQPGKPGSQRRRKIAAALAVASPILGLTGLAASLVLEPFSALVLPFLGLIPGLIGLRSSLRKVAILGALICGVGLALGIVGAVTGRSTGSIGASCPPPGLQSPGAYVSGVADIPDGQYLFVEWWRAQVQSSSDGCQLYFDEPTYSGGSEHLMGQVSKGSGSEPVDGFWGAGRSSQGRECGAFSELTTISGFPFVAPAAVGISEGNIVIQSVDASGAIVVEVKGCTVWIEPGQSWEDQEYENQEASFYRLTNYGFLDESQIHLDGFDPNASEP